MPFIIGFNKTIPDIYNQKLDIIAKIDCMHVVSENTKEKKVEKS